MEKFLLKKRVAWITLVILAFASGIVLSTPLEGVIPAGSLNEEEFKIVTDHIHKIKAYTQNIKAATDGLFTQNHAFQEDLARMGALRDDIIAIHTNIQRIGSPYCQGILARLKGLTQHLRDAQKKWVEILTTQSLLTMGNNKTFMSNKFQDTQRFMLGGTKGNKHDGEGLIGCFTQAGHPDLLAEIEHIQVNIIFIFNYETAAKISKYELAYHLISNKGFSPRLVKMLPKAFFS